MSTVSDNPAYLAVSTANPCRICGHHSWCSVVPGADGEPQTLLCRREPHSNDYGDGRQKTDTSGQPYWVYNLRPPSVTASSLPAPSVAISPTRGSDEDLDKAYRVMLGHLPLSVPHRNDLRSRGVASMQEFANLHYATLDVRGRAKVVAKVVRAGFESELAKTPGFYINRNDKGPFWTIAGSPGMLIPVRNVQGLIAGVVVRTDGAGGKYRWLTSAHKKPWWGQGISSHPRAGDCRR